MAGNADEARFGLASCVAATDTILRALAQVSERDELAELMNAMTRELGFRYYALIHHDDLRVVRSSLRTAQKLSYVQFIGSVGDSGWARRRYVV